MHTKDFVIAADMFDKLEDPTVTSLMETLVLKNSLTDKDSLVGWQVRLNIENVVR